MDGRGRSLDSVFVERLNTKHLWPQIHFLRSSHILTTCVRTT